MEGLGVLSAKVRAFLNEKRFASLATINPDGTPQQSIMWYLLQDNQIMMNTAEGRVKVRNVRRDPRVSICIEDEYRFVTITGRVELDEDRERALNDIHRLAIRYHGQPKADEMMDSFRRDQRLTLFMSIDHVVSNGV
jgi:PPOX class probable F420-dependent enzyme